MLHVRSVYMRRGREGKEGEEETMLVPSMEKVKETLREQRRGRGLYLRSVLSPTGKGVDCPLPRATIANATCVSNTFVRLTLCS